MAAKPVPLGVVLGRIAVLAFRLHGRPRPVAMLMLDGEQRVRQRT